jgi:hypothetical protein
MKLLTPLGVKSHLALAGNQRQPEALGDGGKEQDGFHMWAR